MWGRLGLMEAKTNIQAVHKSDVRSGSDPDLANGDVPQSELRSLIERYTADRGSLFRFFGIEASASRPARMKQFYGEWLATLTQVSFGSISGERPVDYLLFTNHH